MRLRINHEGHSLGISEYDNPYPGSVDQAELEEAARLLPQSPSADPDAQRGFLVAVQADAAAWARLPATEDEILLETGLRRCLEKTRSLGQTALASREPESLRPSHATRLVPDSAGPSTRTRTTRPDTSTTYKRTSRLRSKVKCASVRSAKGFGSLTRRRPSTASEPLRTDVAPAAGV